jgi:hypothetical protein
MYKGRFLPWTMRKNYARGQKREALQRLEQSVQHDTDASELCLDRKPVKMHRLYRPVKQNGKIFKLSARRPRPSKPPILADTLPSHRSSYSALRDRESRHITTPMDIDDVVAILNNARTYYDWSQTQTQISSDYKISAELEDLIDDLVIGGHQHDTNLHYHLHWLASHILLFRDCWCINLSKCCMSSLTFS